MAMMDKLKIMGKSRWTLKVRKWKSSRILKILNYNRTNLAITPKGFTAIMSRQLLIGLETQWQSNKKLSQLRGRQLKQLLSSFKTPVDKFKFKKFKSLKVRQLQKDKHIPMKRWKSNKKLDMASQYKKIL